MIPQLFIALTDAWSTSAVEDAVALDARVLGAGPVHAAQDHPLAAAFSSLFPDTCSCGAGPPPPPDDVSVAVTVTDGYPVALTVKVALPVLAASAVMVMFCEVA